MNDKIAGTSRIEWLPLNELVIDPSAQRGFDENRARGYAANLNLDLIRVIEVSIRADGVKAVMDGQHRVAALRFAGFTNEKVECKVSRGLALKDEADRFNGLNDFKAVRALDKFRVNVTAEDPVAVGVMNILEEHGWRLGQGKSSGLFSAVKAAEKVYTGSGMIRDRDSGPDIFRACVEVATLAWGRGPFTLSTSVITGMGLFFARYGSQVDRASLVKKLAQQAGGAEGLVGKARGLREYRGGTVGQCVAETIVLIYNTKRRVGKLEEWRD